MPKNGHFHALHKTTSSIRANPSERCCERHEAVRHKRITKDKIVKVSSQIKASVGLPSELGMSASGEVCIVQLLDPGPPRGYTVA